MIIVATLAIPWTFGQILSGGRPMLRAHPSAIALVISSVLLQLFASQLPDLARYLVPLAFVLGTISFTAIAWTSTGRAHPTWLAAIGGLCNVIPIAIHGAMPVVTQSRLAISASPSTEPALIAAKHREIQLDDLHILEAFLSDWIPVPFLSAVVSVGDVILVGAFAAIGLAARTKPEPAPS